MTTFTSIYAARAAASLDEGFKTKAAQKDARSDVQRAYEATIGKACRAIINAAPYQNEVRELSHDQYAERAHHFEAYDVPFELRHVREKHMPTFETFGTDVEELRKLIKLLGDIAAAPIAPKPAKAERKPSIEGGELTCQCCARLIKANTGRIAKHGYRRPGDGWQTASCRGAGALPFEASSQALATYVLDLRHEVEQLEERIGKVERNEIKPYVNVSVRSFYPSRRSTQRIWVDRDDFEAAKEEHKLRSYSIYTFEDLQAACIRLIKAELKAAKLELAAQEARLEAWQGPTIEWDGGGWVALPPLGS